MRQETANPAALSDRDFNRLSTFIHDYCGITMQQAKRSMLESRLSKRVRATGIASLSAYVDYLFSPEGAAHEKIHMIDAVTTNKTDFFREPDHFAYLTRKALPAIFSGMTANRNVMIWSAGCSTGEEPYTLAMVLSEYHEQQPGARFVILATDLSTRVLEAAAQGIYDEDRVEPVPPELRKKYLLRSKDQSKSLVRMSHGLRSLIHFRQLNFMEGDFGMREPMDVIFCRNVIIYFDKPTQERLLTRFVKHLRPGGYLFLGHSESLNGLNVPLQPVAPTIYRRPL